MQIQRVGAIGRDGRLREGQRILEVNGQSLLGATHEEAVKALRSAGDRLNLLVCDGYDLSSSTGNVAMIAKNVNTVFPVIVAPGAKTNF